MVMPLIAGLGRALSVCALLASIASCASVHPEDQAAWIGVPVAELDKHPIFLTMQDVRTVASDGTEIRNYVNGHNIASCSQNGSVYADVIDYASYREFTSCMSGFVACNNIFYIKNGLVTGYTPIGTGGARCFTDERSRPGYQSATNF